MVVRQLLNMKIFKTMFETRVSLKKRNMNSKFYEEYGGKIFINNTFKYPKSSNSFKVINPLNDVEIGLCGNSYIDDANDAIEAAYRCFSSWSAYSNDRSRLLLLLSNKLELYKNELANIITSEMGKPINESLKEIDASIVLCKWYSEECERIQGEIILSTAANIKQFVIKQPHGIVGLITPWNFPLNMVIRSMTAALAAGCALVIKPDPSTPFTSLFLAKIIQECNFPPGCVNIIPSDIKQSPSIGYTLCNDARVKHISFTGSTEVGKTLMGHAANSIKRISMELGGNAPYIVFPDANIDLAVECLKYAKFRNAGQTCISANRIFVHKDIVTDFIEKLKTMVSNTIVGIPTNKTTEISCLYSPKGYNKVSNLVEDALKSGAQLEYKSETTQYLGQSYYPPTILSNCNQNMLIANTEIFGPVCTIITFESFPEVIKLSNSTPSGLSAYVFSKDHDNIWKCINSLDFGLIAINESTPSSHKLPFCGLKHSGIGSAELGSYGVKNYMDTKAINIKLSN